MKYEYLIHSLMFGELADMADVNKRLAELGDKGWLLSAVTPDGDAIFAREKSEIKAYQMNFSSCCEEWPEMVSYSID